MIRFLRQDSNLSAKATQRFDEALHLLHSRNDRFFARLLIVQWMAGILIALLVSPQTWIGQTASTHVHVFAAIFLGGGITLYPAWLGWHSAGRPSTRHVLAIAQMLMSALLIHLTGGRIETHFHVFGSLAFLAFYRDLPVLGTATVVVYVDHLLRGWLWPESVYGVVHASAWRSIEHAAWVLFEVGFLALGILRSLSEMEEVARRQVQMEDVNLEMEQTVQSRTQALAESELRFRSVFQHTRIGLFQAAPNGELLLANPALLEMLGVSSHDQLRSKGLRLQDLERDNVEARARMTRLSVTGAINDEEIVWRHEDGSTIHVRVNARTFSNESGVLEQIEGSVTDISEQRELEQRYLQAQKVQALGNLAGGIAHDFNNLLTGIIGFTDLTLMQSAPDSPGYANATEVRKAGERAASLTRQLLAFSRKQELEPRIFQLNDIIGELAKMLLRLVGENIDLRLLLDPGLKPLKADPSQMEQVVMNLVVNARDAMPHGGGLTIETANVTLDDDYCRLQPDAVPGNYGVLTVTDTGTGMSPEIQARIFEPFFTTKEQGQGTGLGLATCHGIIKQSGGHITVYSEPGTGSTFRVYIPTARAGAANHSAPSIPASLPRGTERILLVEDEAIVRTLGYAVLASLGYDVLVATNGAEALEMVREKGVETVDLVVSDVIMPQIGGKQLATSLRKLRSDIRILYCSGYTFDTIARTEITDGSNLFLQKPYTPYALAAKVRKALDKTPANGEPDPALN